MIDNNNHYNHYSVQVKAEVLDRLNDLKNKIETEEPTPDGNIDLDFLVYISKEIQKILNCWDY